MPSQPLRGEIWTADLDPTRGHEQAGKRPVLIVSTNHYNQSPADMVFILPLTRTERRLSSRIPIDPPEGGVKARSYIICDALRAISTERLGERSWGTISSSTLAKVEKILRFLLEI